MPLLLPKNISKYKGKPPAGNTQDMMPTLLLLLSLSAVFVFGNDRGLFYRFGHHDWVTAHSMALAVNLSPEHNFLSFISRRLDADGSSSYTVYNRWPIGGYALIKLATLPFDGELAAQLSAARILMLLLFSATALLAYLALCRITENRWIALTATLLTFSSYYFLYYNDLVAPQCGIALFMGMLTFHSMVVFVQEGRFRQLLVKACVALLLGWQVYALLLPFIVFSLVKEWLTSRSTLPASSSRLCQFRQAGNVLLSSHSLMLGVVTLLFGASLLSWNLGNEYFAMDGYYSLTELPTVRSLRYRIGAADGFNTAYADTLVWATYLKTVFYRIGVMGLPFALNPFGIVRDGVPAGLVLTIVVGVGGLMFSAGLLSLIFARHKLLLGTLLLSGFCWAIPLRGYVAFHDYQAVFHIGIPLVFFTFLMTSVRTLASQKVTYACAAAALLVFVYSTAQVARIGHSANRATFEAEIMDDFANIRSLVDADQVVYVPFAARDPHFSGAPFGVSYFLSGTGIIIEYQEASFATKGPRKLTQCRWNIADFVILPVRETGPALLTPDNHHRFLYDRSLLGNDLSQYRRDRVRSTRRSRH